MDLIKDKLARPRFSRVMVVGFILATLSLGSYAAASQKVSAAACQSPPATAQAGLALKDI